MGMEGEKITIMVIGDQALATVKGGISEDFWRIQDRVKFALPYYFLKISGRPYIGRVYGKLVCLLDVQNSKRIDIKSALPKRIKLIELIPTDGLTVMTIDYHLRREPDFIFKNVRELERKWKS